MRLRAVRCSFTGCARTTLDLSGRCHDHRAATVATPARSTPPPPTVNRNPVRRIVSSDDGFTREIYELDGELHREDGPALVTRRLGVVLLEQWHRYGMQYRVDGPVEVNYTEGVLESEFYRTVPGNYPEGHREDGPAVVEYYPDGKTVRLERWLAKGVAHRDGGPAVIYHRSGDGSIESEEWIVDGDHHRIGGPAISSFATDGMTVGTHYLRGREHRLTGPSTESSSSPGVGHWSIDGKNFPSREWAYAYLRNLPTGRIREILTDSEFAPLLESFTSRPILDALAAGVRTPDGVREVVLGAPAEWVVSFEEGLFGSDESER